MAGAVLAVALCAPAGALASSNPLLSGWTSNSTNLAGATAVAISGHYAYALGYYPGQLAAIDISNPAHPSVAGASGVANSLIDGTTVNVSGGYAYVVSKNRNASAHDNDDGTGNSLTILDVHTNPAVPAIVGSVRDPSQLFGGYGVAVSGGYAYVAGQGILAGQPAAPDSGTGSFAVVNVSDPAHPTIVAHLDNDVLPSPWTGSGALQHVCSVFVAGHYAYVTAAYSDRLTVIDIANPSAPAIVASNNQLAFPVDVAVEGHYAYVANQTENLLHPNFQVVNVANPASPRVVGQLVDPAVLKGAYRVRVHGRFAYLASVDTATVAAVNISNPAHPVLAGRVTSPAHLTATTGLDVDAAGRYVVATSFFQPSQTEPGYPPYPPAPGAPLNTGTVSTIKLDPARIAVKLARSSEPPSVATRTSGSFRFSVSDAIATVQCKLDRSRFGACTGSSSQRYRSLKQGKHTFVVQAADAAGKTATARYRWTVRRKGK